MTPSVNRRLPITSGVELGPFAISTAYWFFLECGLVFLLPENFAVREIDAGHDLFRIASKKIKMIM